MSRYIVILCLMAVWELWGLAAHQTLHRNAAGTAVFVALSLFPLCIGAMCGGLPNRED